MKKLSEESVVSWVKLGADVDSLWLAFNWVATLQHASSDRLVIGWRENVHWVSVSEMSCEVWIFTAETPPACQKHLNCHLLNPGVFSLLAPPTDSSWPSKGLKHVFEPTWFWPSQELKIKCLWSVIKPATIEMSAGMERMIMTCIHINKGVQTECVPFLCAGCDVSQ